MGKNMLPYQRPLHTGIKIMKLASLTTFLTLGLLGLPTQAIAFDFHMGANESVILNDDFATGQGWNLGTSLEIKDGALTHGSSGSYGRASYALDTPLNLLDGAISLYWVAAFPDGAHKEKDAYWPSLQYADNPAVCWDKDTNEVLALPSDGQCLEGYKQVDENSELRVWLRPEHPTTFNRVYVDEGFIPGIDPEKSDNPLAQLELPEHPDPTAEQYRLRIEQIGDTATATLDYWAGSAWQGLTPRRNSSYPLQIELADWINIDGTVQDPIFEALNFQFRSPGPNGIATRVDAVALTQERSGSAPQSVPEPTVLLGLAAIFGFGLKRR